LYAASFEAFDYGDVDTFVSIDLEAFSCYMLSASFCLKLSGEFLVFSDFLVQFSSVFVVV
jgi:hypothetical protein